ncbi:response regulator, partial [Inhella gelatinilytica]
EAERLEAERLEAERLEAERLEAERLEAERLEAERLEAERLEAERLEAERREAERREAERREAERGEAERREAERLEAEQREAERLEAEQREAERLAAQSPAQMAVAPPLPSLNSRELRADETVVFVVDDSKVVRVKTQRALAPQGYQVVLADSGEEAVAKMALHTPHVVITDVEMPGMDGFELTRYVRASATLGAIPVIMITSADDRKAAADAAGVTTLLGKPYAEADLIACIERARLAVQVPA